MKTNIISLVCAGLFLLFANHVEADSAPVAAFFPVVDAFKGDFAAYGATQLSKSPDNLTLTFTSPAEKAAGFVRWFPTTEPIPAATVKGWQSYFVRLEIQATSTKSTTLSVSWRGAVDPAELGASQDQQVYFDGTWQTLFVPVPKLDGISSDRITGLFFKFSDGGEYHLRNMQIVPDQGAAKK